MNGSATFFISIAVCTRASTPILVRVLRSARALILESENTLGRGERRPTDYGLARTLPHSFGFCLRADSQSGTTLGPTSRSQIPCRAARFLRVCREDRQSRPRKSLVFDCLPRQSSEPEWRLAKAGRVR